MPQFGPQIVEVEVGTVSSHLAGVKEDGHVEDVAVRRPTPCHRGQETVPAPEPVGRVGAQRIAAPERGGAGRRAPDRRRPRSSAPVRGTRAPRFCGAPARAESGRGRAVRSCRWSQGRASPILDRRLHALTVVGDLREIAPAGPKQESCTTLVRRRIDRRRRQLHHLILNS